jgi:hypothetical protein
MATKEDYARWITANQDKIGTPEFLTVASAYRQAGQDERRAASSDATANIKPTDGMSGPQKFFAGMGKGMTDLARGGGQILGLVDESDIDASKQRDAALMETGAGFAGNLAGTVAGSAPMAMIPGVNSYLGATLLGTATGAMQPVGSGDSRLQNTVVGGMAGAGGQGLANALFRMLSPQTSKAVTNLMDQDVTPTPGRILGGTYQRLEDAAESIPFVGQGIKDAKTRAIEQFNTAVINRSLGPIGGSVTGAGHQAIRQADDLLSKAYDDALALVPVVQVDNQFDAAMQRVLTDGRTLTPAHAKQLENILDDRIYGRINNATLAGSEAKSIESEIKSIARNYVASADGDQRRLGQLLNETAAELRQMVGRQDPRAGELLKKADLSAAMLMRVDNAAAKQGAADGVFSPSQLGGAIRNMDRSVRKTAISRGDGLLQDMEIMGRDVLGDTLPNSGTADRLMSAGAIGGAATGAMMNHPGPLAAALLARGAYTDPAQKLIATLLARRPNIMRQAGDIVSRGAPISALTAAEAAQ